ncbi:MAG: hypothetical protein WDZ35_05840 [Crocinitomicaceae bacterium]
MKRLFSILLIVTSFASYSQSYRHNVGIGYLGAFQAQSSGNISVFSLSGTPGFRYMAALKWPINDKLDFVLSIDPCIFAFPFNTINGTSIFGSVDIPLDLKLYFGGIDNTSFFVGAGADYFWVSWLSGEKTGLRSFGPQMSLGFNHNTDNLGFGGRASFTYGLTKQSDGFTEIRSNLFSIGIFMILPSPGKSKDKT